jgi:hypothetical protein
MKKSLFYWLYVNIAYQLNRTLTWDPVKEKFNQDEEANQLLGRPMNNEWKIKL